MKKLVYKKIVTVSTTYYSELKSKHRAGKEKK